jgi:hypothetical protein
LNSQDDVAGSHGEAYASPCSDVHQAISIKVEEFSDVEDGEEPMPMTFIGIKAEHEVSCMSMSPLLGISHSYLFIIIIVAKKNMDGMWQLSVSCSVAWQCLLVVFCAVTIQP